MSIKLLYNCFVCFFFHLYTEYNNCLISFLSISELFPAFNWAKVIGNLLIIWFGVKIFKPFAPVSFWIFLLKLRIFSTIFNILSGFSISISSLDISAISVFKSCYPLLITFTYLLFLFLSFVSNNFFAKALGTTLLKYFLSNS